MIRRNIFPALESKYLLGVPYPFTSHPYVADFKALELKLTWKNGSVWLFGSWDNPEALEGANVDFGHLDEARLVLHLDTALLTMKRRLRGSGRCKVPIKPAFWITTTTDKPGSVLFNELEDPHLKNPDSRIYRWSIFDNPFLTKDFITAMLQSHTGGLAERFIYGRFANVGTGSFPFDSSLHVRESADARLLNVSYGVDFGWTNPSAIIVNGYDRDDRVYALDEFYHNQTPAETLIAELQAFKTKYGAGPVYCDKSEPESIEKFKKAGLDAKPYEFKREDGIRELGARFLKAGDGRPRAYVSSKCINLISELLEYDSDKKERDHAVDAWRYSLRLKPEAPLNAFSLGARRGLYNRPGIR